jgi:3-dehydroquinate dehydratase
MGELSSLFDKIKQLVDLLFGGGWKPQSEFYDLIHNRITGTDITAKQLADYGIGGVRCHLRGEPEISHPYVWKNGKWDLYQWDEQWFSILRRNVKRCIDEGMDVTVELFNSSEFKGKYKDTEARCPYYRNHNHQGIGGGSGDIRGDVYIAAGAMADVAKRLARKVAQELRSHQKHCSILLANEPERGDQTGWHRMVLNEINKAGWKGGTIINPPAYANADTVKAFVNLKPTCIEVHTNNVNVAKAWRGWIGSRCKLIVSSDTGVKGFDIELAKWCKRNKVAYRYWRNCDGAEYKQNLKRLREL